MTDLHEDHNTTPATEETQTQTTQPESAQHESTQAAPSELREVLPQLQGEELDEDAVLDEQEGEDEEYIDAGELFAMLAKLQETLDDQTKEIRGLRREMRELREQGGQVSQAPREGGYQGGNREGGFRPREDRGERGGYQGGNREGGFRPREDRGERGSFNSYQGDRQAPRDAGAAPRARRDMGWGNNKRRDDE